MSMTEVEGHIQETSYNITRMKLWSVYVYDLTKCFFLKGLSKEQPDTCTKMGNMKHHV